LKPAKQFEISVQNLIEEAVKSKHPVTVEELAQVVLPKTTLTEEDFIAAVKNMERDGSLTLQEPLHEVETPLDYLFNPTLSAWLWATLSVTALSVAAVVLTPESFPIVSIRWLLGSILVLYLPGYALLQLLFPKASEIDSLERFALNIGLSLALVPLIGLVLNYTPWGIRFVPITSSLSAFVIAFAVAAATRKYLETKEESKRR